MQGISVGQCKVSMWDNAYMRGMDALMWDDILAMLYVVSTNKGKWNDEKWNEGEWTEGK